MRKLIILCFLLSFATCKNAQFYAEQGLTHLEAGRSVTSLTLFEKALSKDANNSLALFGKGILMVQKKLTSDMGQKMLLRSWQGLQRLDLKEKALLNISNVYRLHKQSASAITLFKKALATNVDTHQIRLTLANFYIQHREKKKAISLLDDTVKKYSKNSDVYYNYAVLLASEFKNYKKAFEYFEKSNELKKDRIDTLYNLMSTSYLLRNYDRSLEFYEALLKLPMKKENKLKLLPIRDKIKKRRWQPNK